MQAAVVRFTKNEIAKYPFLKAAKRYVKVPDLKVEDLVSPELKEIIRRAEERVEEAILENRVSRRLQREDVEILSYPAAIALVTATGSSFIKKRYALAEAKQAFEDLKDEPNHKILRFAQNFEWNLMINEDSEIPFEFKLDFAEYLRNTTHLRSKEWKLVNRLLTGGNVYLTKRETARLLSEEVRNYVEKSLEAKQIPEFPAPIKEKAEKIKKLCMETIGKTEKGDLPKTIQQAAFPPCVKTLYDAITVGRHLSHIGRFTLTSFLVNAGMSTEEVVELFKSFSDYNQRMTRYQVEHIAGERGSRTRYIPPRCDTLRTHGVCAESNELCQRIRHPLSYYRRKLDQENRRQ